MKAQVNPRLTDVVRVVLASVVAMVAAAIRCLLGLSRRDTWSFRLETILGAYRGSWSVMPKIGVVRWRRVGDRLSPKLTSGLRTTGFDAPGLTGEWFEPPEEDGRVLLYFHGGGFVFGSLRTGT